MIKEVSHSLRLFWKGRMRWYQQRVLISARLCLPCLGQMWVSLIGMLTRASQGTGELLTILGPCADYLYRDLHPRAVCFAIHTSLN